MISLLLTRGAQENAALKLSLKGYDFDFLDLPLIEYKDKVIKKDVLTKFNNIIITSKHAAKIAAAHHKDFNIEARFFVVGEISAEILQSSRLKVERVASNVDDLIAHLPEKIYAQAVYLSSSEITQELPKEIKRLIIYNVKYKTSLTAQEVESLNQDTNYYAMLYSVNSAKALVSLLETKNLMKKLQNMTVFAISAGVAKEVLPYFKKIIYCEKGEHKKMIELLISHAKNSRKFKEAD